MIIQSILLQKNQGYKIYLKRDYFQKEEESIRGYKKVRKQQYAVQQIWAIEHVFDGGWYLLLNAVYTKLKINFVQLNAQKFQLSLAEISVFMTEKASIIIMSLKFQSIIEKTKFQKELLQMRNKDINSYKIGRDQNRTQKISFLLIFDFMNIQVQALSLIKSDKLLKYFLLQYCSFNKKNNSYFTYQLIKSYNRLIIENQQHFNNYINNKQFYSKLFNQEQIKKLAFLKYYFQIEMIYHIFHLQSQHVAIAFYESILNFIRKTRNLVVKQELQIQLLNNNSPPIQIMFLKQQFYQYFISKRIVTLMMNNILFKHFLIIQMKITERKILQKYLLNLLKQQQECYFEERKFQLYKQNEEIQQQDLNNIFFVATQQNEYNPPSKMLSLLKKTLKIGFVLDAFKRRINQQSIYKLIIKTIIFMLIDQTVKW
ncbi:unnamed protein product [Paramecium sonneborni]|uniref:Uncharacterized protein n=1 Tax=Paramecium sonneborni TaxID=65129 RepID=A0A8S1RRZ9_9CILI|nr:unnamed protein product [Paramecium sonneborni]